MRSLRHALAAALLTATAANAQVQTLTLHYNSGYGAPSFPLILPATSGQLLALPPAFNDQVTSMQWNLQPGTIVTLYENSDGSGREYTIRRHGTTHGRGSSPTRRQ